jgi:nucleoside-diphosphate-sugar epimerase
MFGDGGQGVDFVHVDDVSRVIAGLIGLPRRSLPRVLNVGSGRVTSIRRLAETFVAVAAAVIGREVAIVTEEAPPGKVWPDRWVSIERLQALFPKFPETTLEQGIRELLAA